MDNQFHSTSQLDKIITTGENPQNTDVNSIVTVQSGVKPNKVIYMRKPRNRLAELTQRQNPKSTIYGPFIKVEGKTGAIQKDSNQLMNQRAIKRFNENPSEVISQTRSKVVSKERSLFSDRLKKIQNAYKNDNATERTSNLQSRVFRTQAGSPKHSSIEKSMISRVLDSNANKDRDMYIKIEDLKNINLPRVEAGTLEPLRHEMMVTCPENPLDDLQDNERSKSPLRTFSAIDKQDDVLESVSQIKTNITKTTFTGQLQELNQRLQEERDARMSLKNELDELKQISSQIAEHLKHLHTKKQI